LHKKRKFIYSQTTFGIFCWKPTMLNGIEKKSTFYTID
jgi:hypothetical protein